MSQTIVGVFSTASAAQQVSQELMASGVDRSHIQLSQESAGTAAATTHQSTEHQGFWESLKDAFGFGDDDDRYGYREAARRGNTIVSVTADDAQVDRVCDILQRHNPIDIDSQAKTWGTEGWSGYETYQKHQQAAPAPRAAAGSTGTAAAAATQRATQGEEAIPVVEEQLQIGKRAVARGGVRVASRVTERPVEEQISLREEHVNVERRPVDRPLTTADATDAFRERSIEATETAEEAVVAKTARVVEEVVVNKEAGQRTETVRDTVRRTDVDVQQIEGGATDERFRPAYTFADEISADQRYHGRSFDEVETDLRSSYEQRNPDSRWDDVRDAVRSRYGRSRSNA